MKATPHQLGRLISLCLSKGAVCNQIIQQVSFFSLALQVLLPLLGAHILYLFQLRLLYSSGFLDLDDDGISLFLADYPLTDEFGEPFLQFCLGCSCLASAKALHMVSRSASVIIPCSTASLNILDLLVGFSESILFRSSGVRSLIFSHWDFI